jgi:hypothetical protein
MKSTPKPRHGRGFNTNNPLVVKAPFRGFGGHVCILILFLALLPCISMAQAKYQINGVPVIEHGDTLIKNAWVGGFNNPVFSSIDLNQDGLMDLFVYDKAGWKAVSFINTGSVGHPSFTYAPEYDGVYPTDLRDWAVIRDYNHDGVGDIFALTSNSDIEVYKGYRNGNNLSYIMIYKKLMYPDGNFMDHIWTFSDNMPIFMDIDGDGALDVLAPNINAVTLNYYHNVAVDSGYSPDSLVFTLGATCDDQAWGLFTEDYGDCNVQLGLTMCKKELVIDTPGRDLRHQGGACWGTKYDRNSNVISVYIADIYCNTIKFLENTGTTTHAEITFVDTLFPSYDVQINISLMPSIYGIDADNDGFEDFLVAPFASNANVPSQSEDINVIHYYHNNAGTDSLNTYHYEGDTLLNNSIVDVGTESHPVFFDYNGDGLMDIVIGRFGQFVSPGNPALGSPGTSISSLFLYKNVGTDTMPIYQLIDTDWNHLSVFDSTGLLNGQYPAFGDLDGDSLPDMVVGDFAGNINFFHNAGTATNATYPSMTGPNWFGINVGNDAAPFIYDMNGDGLNDLIIGSSGRSPSLIGSHIFYYWNFGTPTHPMFSPDSVNKFFGNVVVWDSSIGIVEGFSTPVIVKENDSLMLYSGSQRGLTFKFLVNKDSLRHGGFAELSSDVLGVKPGLRSNVSIADINHDGRNDYLTGNIRGGIMLFSDTAWSISSTRVGITEIAPNEQMQVFPNPARDRLTCRLSGDDAVLTGAMLYNLLGEVMAIPVNKESNNTIVLSVSSLSEGIYIVRITDSNGKSFQQKISVIK